MIFPFQGAKVFIFEHICMFLYKHIMSSLKKSGRKEYFVPVTDKIVKFTLAKNPKYELDFRIADQGISCSDYYTV